MRCPDCCKFVSLDTEEPVVEELVIESLGEEKAATIRTSVTISRVCADCSLELKSTTLDAEAVIEIPEIPGIPSTEDHVHLLEIEESSIESTETGGGRNQKNLIGFSLSYVVTCEKDGCNLKIEDSIEDAIPASQFEETV